MTRERPNCDGGARRALSADKEPHEVALLATRRPAGEADGRSRQSDDRAAATAAHHHETEPESAAPRSASRCSRRSCAALRVSILALRSRRADCSGERASDRARARSRRGRPAVATGTAVLSGRIAAVEPERPCAAGRQQRGDGEPLRRGLLARRAVTRGDAQQRNVTEANANGAARSCDLAGVGPRVTLHDASARDTKPLRSPFEAPSEVRGDSRQLAVNQLQRPCVQSMALCNDRAGRSATTAGAVAASASAHAAYNRNGESVATGTPSACNPHARSCCIGSRGGRGGGGVASSAIEGRTGIAAGAVVIERDRKPGGAGARRHRCARRASCEAGPGVEVVGVCVASFDPKRGRITAAAGGGGGRRHELSSARWGRVKARFLEHPTHPPVHGATPLSDYEIFPNISRKMRMGAP